MEYASAIVMRLFLFLAALNGFLAVALGAFGAHGLEHSMESLPDAAQRLAWWETASRYHLTHAVVLGVVGLVADRVGGTLPRTAGYAFQLGLLLFCGSLYAMTLSGVRQLGAVTPFGGVALLVGWCSLAISALRLPRLGSAKLKPH